jgi:predicted nucleotidyltransferase
MLQIKPDKPLPSTLILVIRTLDDVAAALQLDYFLIGAMARDILLEHVYGVPTSRATMDIDFAVAVASWDEFDKLKKDLVATGMFAESANAHRLTFCNSGASYPIDLVPFDGVQVNDEIAWPPGGDFVMNVSGYRDARSSALRVEIAPGFQVNIVSLSVMVVLKILAWNDRPERDKHASDIFLILANYCRAGQFDRMYNDASDLLEQYDYDFAQTGAALLGRDARRDIIENTLAQVRNVFDSEKRFDRFSSQMIRASHGEQEHAMLLLSAFLREL